MAEKANRAALNVVNEGLEFCIYNDIWEPCQYCLSKRFTVACIKIFGDGKQSTTISDPPRSLPLADDAQISPSDKLLYHHAFSDQILLSKPNFLPLTLIRKFAAGNGGVITSPSLRQAILALSAFAIKSDGGFDDKVTEYVGKACMELRRKTEGTIDDMDLGAIYILTHIQRDERPVHAVGLLTVLGLLNSSLSQGSRTQDCLRRFRTVSFDYAATIPTSHTARTNIRQALYRNVYFRFPTLEDRISCYVEFNAPRNYNGIEAAVCISLSHQFSRLLDLLYLSTQTGEVTFEQESLLRDTEEELRGREYKRLEGVARTAMEVPESIFQVPNMGLLGLNSILYLGIQLLIKVLDPLTETDEHILGAARTLVEVLWKARITVYINPRRGPWMSALLLLTTLVLPKGDLEQYDFYFLRNRMDEFAMYDAIQEYWETEDKMAALETLQFFATNWRPFW